MHKALNIQKQNQQKGFTLIELTVVIAIITLLASVVLVATASARFKAKNAQRIENISQVTKALELYYANNNSYPVGTYYSGWDTGGYAGSDHHCWCTSTSTGGSLEQDLSNGAYVSNLPQDPTPQPGDGNYLNDGQGLGYMYVSDGQSYCNWNLSGRRKYCAAEYGFNFCLCFCRKLPA